MKTVQIEFSKYELVNFLWPELIEDYGFDKARKIAVSYTHLTLPTIMPV